MRRNLLWVVVLLVLGAAAIPAAATVTSRTPGAIEGTVIDAVTGHPFSTSGGQAVSVEAFNTATAARYRTFDVDSEGTYEIPDLPPGIYKVRFRYYSDAGLIRYRWNDNKANYDVADEVVVASGGATTVDAALPRMAGGTLSGAITAAGTGDPVGGNCIYVEVFEASGVSLGIIALVPVSGAWSTSGKVPAGRLTMLAAYSPWGEGCAANPSHLDRWYRGASGSPLHPDNLIADPATFATARTVLVGSGTNLTGLNFVLTPAPTCRGRVPTIFGTTLDDAIDGTPGRDIISGLAGNDTIRGLGGDDLLCGDTGNDTLVGGPGMHDVAVGGPGIDTCSAETTLSCP